MIIKTEEKNGIKVYTVGKEFNNEKMSTKLSKYVKPEQIHKIINHDADVYTEEGRLLLRFRKNALTDKNIDIFYDNVNGFARNNSGLRGTASGGKHKTLGNIKKVMSNIFGYFDKWSPSHKVIFKRLGKKPDVNVRECRFNQDHPEKYKKAIPLIQEIDALYAKLTPEQYKEQRKKANETFFKIPNTSFTTVTTNINYQTSIHTDKGDDDDGFGNLAVIERGEYTGGETCFPQYGIGVDVRNGDILFMDVHQPHANLPIHKKTKETVRLSIVCYLRRNVWLNSRNKTKKFYDSHVKMMRNMRTTQKKR
jgi:hypothetical protein